MATARKTDTTKADTRYDFDVKLVALNLAAGLFPKDYSPDVDRLIKVSTRIETYLKGECGKMRD